LQRSLDEARDDNSINKRTEPPTGRRLKQAAFDPFVKVGAICAEARPPPVTAPEQKDIGPRDSVPNVPSRTVRLAV
jgi:hypothetical protein